jgi:hypothetical protein
MGGDGAGWGSAGKGSGKRERDKARPLPAPLRTDFSIEPAWGGGTEQAGSGGTGRDSGLGGSGGPSPGSLSGGGDSEPDGFGGMGDGRGTDVWSSADEALGVTSPLSSLSSPSLFSRLGEGLGLLAPSPGPATAARQAGAGTSPALETARRSGGLLSVPLSRCCCPCPCRTRVVRALVDVLTFRVALRVPPSECGAVPLPAGLPPCCPAVL